MFPFTGTSSGVIKTIPGISETLLQNGTIKMKTEDLSYYMTIPLTPDFDEKSVQRFNDTKGSSNYNLTQNVIISKKVCQDKFCCSFDINMTVVYRNVNISSSTDDNFNRYKYRLAVFDGVRTFDGVTTGGIQACSIIPCLTDSLKSCGLTTLGIQPLKVNSTVYNVTLYSTTFNNVTIRTETLDKEAFAEPTIIEPSEVVNMFGSLMSPNKFKFQQDGQNSELKFATEKLGTAGIYARVFSRDGNKEGANSSSQMIISSFLVIFTFLVHLLKQS